MTWIDLGDPHPKQSVNRYDPIVWDVGESLQLPECSEELIWPFNEARIQLRSAIPD